MLLRYSRKKKEDSNHSLVASLEKEDRVGREKVAVLFFLEMLGGCTCTSYSVAFVGHTDDPVLKTRHAWPADDVLFFLLCGCRKL
jgi:hypothetical protein